jgi:hypothetical protein
LRQADISSYYHKTDPERDAMAAATLRAKADGSPPLSPTTTCSLMARLSLSTPGALPPVAMPEGLRLPAQLDDVRLACACAVFGHAAGSSVVPGPGTNEFLSTLVALSVLSPHLSLFHLLAVSILIEATIPFRPHTYLEELRARVEEWAPECLRGRLLTPPSERLVLALGLEPIAVQSAGCDTLGAMLAAGARLASRDVGNFAEPDPRIFLVNAWRLLPENCPALLAGFGRAALADVRGALAGTAAFYAFLPPDRVFHPCPGGVDEAMHEALTVAAARNLAIGRTYVGAALVAAASAEALARLSGGDAPGMAAVLEVEADAHGAVQADAQAARRAVDMSCPRARISAPAAHVARTLLALGRHSTDGTLSVPVPERGDHLAANMMPLAAHVAQRLHVADLEADATAAAAAAALTGDVDGSTGDGAAGLSALHGTQVHAIKLTCGSPCGSPSSRRRTPSLSGRCFARKSMNLQSSEATDAAVAAARRFHAGELTPETLLAAVPQTVVRSIAQLLGAKDAARIPALARFVNYKHTALRLLTGSAGSADIGYASHSPSPTAEDHKSSSPSTSSPLGAPSTRYPFNSR